MKNAEEAGKKLEAMNGAMVCGYEHARRNKTGRVPFVGLLFKFNQA